MRKPSSESSDTKLHKSNIPMRPIVSFCGSPTCQLSKHLTSILKPLTDESRHKLQHHLKTSRTIDWDSATCATYSTDYYQRITLESWFTNLEQTALNRCQPLPAPYKRLLNKKQKHIVYYSPCNPCIYVISARVFTANHITRLPTATLSIDQSNRSPGFLNFQTLAL